MKHLFYFMFLPIFLTVLGVHPATAGSFEKISKPPLSERWFGIYVDNDRVGYYRLKIEETSDGYRMEGDGNVRIRVMGFSKVAAAHEIYLVGRNLSLRSLDVEQTINGIHTHLYGKVGDEVVRIRCESNGKTAEKQLKFRGAIYPGPALNIYPMMHDIVSGKSYKLLTFDPEEVRVKEVKVSVLGEEKAGDGSFSLKLRNSLYPFVNNDIWIDGHGNTIFESVRDGLVTTKAEDSKVLEKFVANKATAK